MNLKPLLLMLGLACIPATLAAQKTYSLSSPDGNLRTTVTVGDEIRLRLDAGDTPLLAPSPVAMTLEGGEVLGQNARVVRTKKSSVDQTIASPLYKKNRVVERYNQLTLSFRGDFGLVVRLYDDGLAYRFTTDRKGTLRVEDECVAFTFPSDCRAVVPYVARGKEFDFESQFFNSFENTYTTAPITELNPGRLIFLPALVELDGGYKLVITEADLEGYPGLYLRGNGETPELRGVFAPYPRREEQGGHNQLQMLVREREGYIASTVGCRAFPWRTVIVAREDRELLDNDMVYRLAPESRIEDTSWIRPGKVAWDWWNDWNLYGVDFEAGINNDTYKYYIDFASRNGIEYVILDEGWAVNKKADLMQVVPEIDLRELVAYARERNVGIILWAGYHAFDRDMERVVSYFAEMGVKGFKVDFMDRDDQKIVDFLHRAARVCAEHRMLLDFHGIFKPTGLNRTWPNVINYEGVFGLEQMKWSPETVDQVTYDVTMPFIRMVAGTMDYTQGAMRNATRRNYRPVNTEPMSQGTRCRQLAEYIVFESPLNMLCDSPSNYLKEPECFGFIASVPTVWNRTEALDGKLGERIAIARQSGDTWYVGALTNWDARDMVLDLSFLEGDGWKVESFSDGRNAHRAACDYVKRTEMLPADKKLTVKMAPGGGFAARIYR